MRVILNNFTDREQGACGPRRFVAQPLITRTNQGEDVHCTRGALGIGQKWWLDCQNTCIRNGLHEQNGFGIVAKNSLFPGYTVPWGEVQQIQTSGRSVRVHPRLLGHPLPLALQCCTSMGSDPSENETSRAGQKFTRPT